VLPVGQQLAPAAVGEVVGAGADQRPAQVVAGHAAVAVGEPPAGRDHERRVGDDQVEALVADRFEQAALAQVRLPGAGQGQGEAGEVQGARVEVGGRHLGGVPGGVQGLDA